MYEHSKGDGKQPCIMGRMWVGKRTKGDLCLLSDEVLILKAMALVQIPSRHARLSSFPSQPTCESGSR